MGLVSTQPADVTDEEIDYAVLQAVGFDGMGTQEMSQFDCRNIARAILALRPQAAEKRMPIPHRHYSEALADDLLASGDAEPVIASHFEKETP